MIYFAIINLCLISFSVGFQNPQPPSLYTSSPALTIYRNQSVKQIISSSKAFHTNYIGQSIRKKRVQLQESGSPPESECTFSNKNANLLSSIASHRIASILYILTTFVSIATEGLGVGEKLIAGASTATAIKIQPGQFSATKLGGALGFAVAAGVSRILHKYTSAEGDVEKEEESVLDADSCRKLNFGLLSFSLVGLFAVPGEASLSYSSTGSIATSTFALAVQYVSRVVGLLAAFRGWISSNGIQLRKGEGQKRGFVKDLRNGLMQTWASDEIDGDESVKKNSIYSTVFMCTLLGMVNNAMTFQHVKKVSFDIFI